ncbi:MAG: PglL family O-oligosaccharyltransferase [Ramlibacter sp.]
MQAAEPVGPAARRAALAWALSLACLVLPWINPFASGPSASVDPWLVSALCVALLFALQPPARLAPVLPCGAAALVAWSVVGAGVIPETVALAAALLLVLMAAGSAAGGARQREFVDAVALGWLVAAAISTAFALAQYFGMADRLAPLVNASSSNEAFANLRQRNQFAALTVMGMASLFWLHPVRLARWPAVALIAWLAVGDAATTSRTGLVQMLVLGALACIWPGPRRERVLLWLAGLLAYGLAALALPWLLEQVNGEVGNRLWERVAAVDACSSRTVLWSNVLHLVAQKPWLGWGWGELDYAHFATLYEGPRFCDILDNAHSLPLHVAVELGVPAAVLACGGLLWAVVRARPLGEADPARQMAWAVLVVMGLHSMLEYPLWYGPFQLALGLCLGLLWGAPRAVGAAGAARVDRLPAMLVGACVTGACLYAAWDYRRVSQIYLQPEARMPAYRDDPLPLIRQSWLFRNQALFAELTIVSLTRENAQWTYDTARTLIHYSPEPRVAEKLVEAATLLGRQDEVLLDLARWRAAFPESYEKWSKERSGGRPSAQPAT